MIFARSDRISLISADKNANNANKEIFSGVSVDRYQLHPQLKQPSKKLTANCRSIIFASDDRLSVRLSSSTTLSRFFVCFFFMSQIVPVDSLIACWRWRTKGWLFEDSTSASLPASSAGLGFLLGFRETAMVVPKREWRDDALRAISFFLRSSVARRRRRLSWGC